MALSLAGEAAWAAPPKTLVEQAKRHLDSGEFAQAVEAYGQVLQADPKSASSYGNRGIAQIQLGRAEEAVQDLSRAIELYTMPTRSRGSRLHAAGSKEQPREEAADKPISEAARAQLPICRTHRGLAYVRLGDDARALADFEAAMQLDPKYPRAWFSRGELRARQGKLHEAVSDYSEGLRHAPSNATALYERGQLYSKLKDSPRAVADYNAALEIQPGYPEAIGSRALEYLDAEGFRPSADGFQRLPGVGLVFRQDVFQSRLRLRRQGAVREGGRRFRTGHAAEAGVCRGARQSGRGTGEARRLAGRPLRSTIAWCGWAARMPASISIAARRWSG